MVITFVAAYHVKLNNQKLKYRQVRKYVNLKGQSSRSRLISRKHFISLQFDLKQLNFFVL